MMLVSETGELVSPGDWHLRQLCPRMSEQEFIVYAIRNCGAVAIEHRNNALRVRWRPEGLAAATLAGLVQWLSDQPDQKVVISRLGDKWSHTVAPSCTAAITALLDIHAAISKRRRRFYRQRRRLEEATEPRFSGTLAFVSEHRRVLDLAGLAAISDSLFTGRFLLLRQVASRLLVQKVGGGFLTIDPHWSERGNEIEVEDQPDLDYGRWIADAYWAASRTGEPVLDDVDAEVETGPGVVHRLRYRRLIVPAVDPAGTKLLLCTSEADGHIDLAGRS